MRRSSPTWSKRREVRARAAGSVRYVVEHRGGRRVSGGGPGDGLSLVPGSEPAGRENRAPLARKAFGVGGVRAQERALGDSHWAAGTFLEVPDNLLVVVQDRELMSKVDAAFFRTAEARGG